MYVHSARRSRIKKSIIRAGIVSVVNFGICPMAAEEEEEHLKLLPHDSLSSFGFSVSYTSPFSPISARTRARIPRLSLILKYPKKVHHLLVGGSPLSIYDRPYNAKPPLFAAFCGQNRIDDDLLFILLVRYTQPARKPPPRTEFPSASGVFLLSVCARASRPRSAYFESMQEILSGFFFVRNCCRREEAKTSDRVHIPGARVPGARLPEEEPTGITGS